MDDYLQQPADQHVCSATIVELGALMTDLEADPSVKVVVFQSANPESLSTISMYPKIQSAERPEVLGL
jgi:enoyl-CoA hydratase/carnithine racemase